MRFLKALAACAPHRAGTTLSQCANLACGGTGSGTLARTLGAVSALLYTYLNYILQDDDDLLLEEAAATPQPQPSTTGGAADDAG